MVYDITSKSTFERATEYWIEELKKCGPENIIIALVGNKSDKANEDREVLYKDGER